MKLVAIFLILISQMQWGFGQEKPEIAKIHTKVYKKISPAIVGVETARGSFTGFFVTSNGVILTSSLAIGEQKYVKVFTTEAKKYRARVLKVIKDVELAILKIDADRKFPYIRLADSDEVKVGQFCYTFANCFGSISTDAQVAMSMGLVSGRYEIKETDIYHTLVNRTYYRGEVIETSAAVNEGSYGGPLVNIKGKVTGMLIFTFHKAKFTGLAIPINKIKVHVKHLLAPGYLGLHVEDSKDKVVIAKVSKQSPAEKAGLQAGDVVLAFNNKTIKSAKELKQKLSVVIPGEKCVLKILRKDTKLIIEVVADEMDSF